MGAAASGMSGLFATCGVAAAGDSMPKGSELTVLEDGGGAEVAAVLLLLLLSLLLLLVVILLLLLPPNMLIRSLVGDRGAAFNGAALEEEEVAEDPSSRLNMSAPRVSPALPEGAGWDPSSGVLCIVLFFLSFLLRF